VAERAWLVLTWVPQAYSGICGSLAAVRAPLPARGVSLPAGLVILADKAKPGLGPIRPHGIKALTEVLDAVQTFVRTG